jgi:dihydrofolate reductase
LATPKHWTLFILKNISKNKFLPKQNLCAKIKSSIMKSYSESLAALYKQHSLYPAKLWQKSDDLTWRMNMSKVVAAFAISLDGFIADAKDDVHRLFQWLARGDTALLIPGGDRTFMTSQASAEQFRMRVETIGALVTGRRDFDVSRAWGGKRPLDVPTFIVTHTAPQEWSGKESPFTFITEGVKAAVEEAKKVAGHKHVAVSGSKITQQCIEAGLLDELHIDLVPVLLGEGIRLFDHLGAAPIELESTGVVEAPGVTHLAFRVMK